MTLGKMTLTREIRSGRSSPRDIAWHSAHTPKGAKRAAQKAANAAMARGLKPLQVKAAAEAASLALGSPANAAHLHGIASFLHAAETRGLQVSIHQSLTNTNTYIIKLETRGWRFSLLIY